MASVGSCSVKSVWIGMGTPTLVQTAGMNSHSTSKTPKVSTKRLRENYVATVILVHVGKNEIKALKVKCSNIERNCQWEGTVGTLEAHVATCEFTLLPCPKECKDDTNEITHFMRKNLDKHLENDCPNRDHECEYCGEKGTYAHITKVHDEICELKILPCPNECTKTMPRQDIEKHVELECEYTVIACKFKNIGCMTEMKRGDMEEHEQKNRLHLSKALNAVVKLQDSNTQLQENMLKLESAANTAITFKLTEFQQKKDSDELFTSPSFYTSPGGYHMAMEVHANGYDAGRDTHVSVYARILEGECDTELSGPFIGKVTFSLLNQLENKNHRTSTLTFDLACNARIGDSWGFKFVKLHSELAHDPVKNTQYLKDDTLYFRVSVEASDHKPWLECTTK